MSIDHRTVPWYRAQIRDGLGFQPRDRKPFAAHESHVIDQYVNEEPVEELPRADHLDRIRQGLGLEADGKRNLTIDQLRELYEHIVSDAKHGGNRGEEDDTHTQPV